MMAVGAFLCLLGVFCCFSGAHCQRIISFRGYVGNRSCTQPYVAREYLDKFYIQAELDPQAVNLRDWWVFALVSPRGKREDLMGVAMLGDCVDTSPPPLFTLSSDDTVCWKKGRLLNVIFVIGVTSSHNGTVFRGLWSNLNSGTTQSKDFALKTVSPEEEQLTINGKALNYEYPEMRFRMGNMARVKYCVTNVAAHELTIKFGPSRVTSRDDCVTFNITVRGADIDRRFTIGINETAGICKRVIYRDFIVGDGSLEIDKYSWRRSTSGSSQTFIQSLGILLILACLHLKRVII